MRVDSLIYSLLALLTAEQVKSRRYRRYQYARKTRIEYAYCYWDTRAYAKLAELDGY